MLLTEVFEHFVRNFVLVSCCELRDSITDTESGTLSNIKQPPVFKSRFILTTGTILIVEYRIVGQRRDQIFGNLVDFGIRPDKNDLKPSATPMLEAVNFNIRAFATEFL